MILLDELRIEMTGYRKVAGLFLWRWCGGSGWPMAIPTGRGGETGGGRQIAAPTGMEDR